MQSIGQDLRYALRMLRTNPGTTAIAVLSLALGIGANTAIFSVIDALLLRPLPYVQPDRIVQVWSSTPAKGYNRVSLSLPDAEDVANSGAFAAAATVNWNASSLTGEGEARRVVTVEVGAGFFDVLGIQAELGRVLRRDEAGPASPRVLVISHGFWQRQFGSDPGVIGKVIQLDGVATEIVGVMPKTFGYPNGGAMGWAPNTAAVNADRRGSRGYRMIARLAPGLSLTAATERVDGLGRQLAEAYPQSNQGMSFALQDLRDGLYGKSFETVSMILLVAVLAVLLVACGNVANLLLARAATRGRETALRSALGASHLRLIRQYLMESMTLALVGGLAGVLVSLWGIDALAAMMPQTVPRVEQIGMNPMVLGYAVLLTLLSGLVFGLAPALQSARTSAAEALKDGGRGQSGGRQSGRLRNTLVIVELAVALVLVMSAGLMLRSFAALREIDPGFRNEGLLTVNVTLPPIPFTNDSLRDGYANRARAALAALPGVVQVTSADILPGGLNNSAGGFTIVGQPEPRPEDRPNANERAVSAEYFSALQIPLRNGRLFGANDGMHSARVVILNESAARRYFAGSNPVGAQLQRGSGEPWTVVGVVADFRERALDDDVWPTMFIPFGQSPSDDVQFAIRTSGDPAAMGGPARAALLAVDSRVPVGQVSTMIERQSESRTGDWIFTRLLAFLGTVALVLAAAGVFGVMAYTVTQRTSEFGVRMAVGASQDDIMRLVLREGLRLGLVGIGIGLLLSLASTRVLGKFLAGLSPLDPWTWVGVTVALLGSVMLASYLPARRATRADPMHSLRTE